MKKMMEQHSMEEKKVTKSTFVLYSLLFLIITVLIFGYFIVLQKSFIWESDGFTQHYLIFKDYLGLMRDFLRDPSNGLPMWNWTIGLGADVLTSYGYYVIGDPFVYLGLLFPESLTELAFHLLILLRVYVIGLSFLLYCRQMSFNSSGALFGSVIYTFTYYVTLNITRHPFFLLPMILFPLLCLGMEKILHNEANTFFILMVFLGAFSNFYFFYMLTLLIVIYALTRYFHLFGIKEFRRIWGYIWTAAYSYLTGLLLSGMLFIPMVWAFLHSSRESGQFAMGLWVYPLQYYGDLFHNLLISDRYLWTVLGFSAFVVLLMPMLFLRRTYFGSITTLLCLFAVLLLLPAFGSIMNGFAGPYNRWTFAIPFFIALGSALLYDERFRLRLPELKAMGVSLAIFSILTGISVAVSGIDFSYILPLFVAGGMFFILLGAYRNSKKKRLTDKRKKMYSALLFLLMAGNLTFNAMEYYYPWGQNTMEFLLDYGTADTAYENTFDGAEELIADDGTNDIYRIGSTSSDAHIRNQMILLGRMGLNSYLSVTNGEIANFARQLESGQFQLIQPVRNGFDDRRITNHFLGVRYIITETENEQYLPYSYEVVRRVQNNGSSFSIAETQQSYPFAYSQQLYLPEEDFEQLNPIDKEVFLSYGVVLDPEKTETEGLVPFDAENDFSGLTQVEFELHSEDLDKVIINQEGLAVRDPEGVVTLTIKNPEALDETEVFVYLEGLQFEPLPTDSYQRDETSYTARVTMGDYTKAIYQSDRLSFSSYIHRDSMLFNLGYQSGSADTIQLQMDGLGSFDIDDITVFSLPLDEDYSERVSQKRENALAIEEFTDEEIRGSIEQNESGILTTSIPYSDGWKASVNDSEVEVIRVNEGFIGIPLEAGLSEITFRYRTPFFTVGIAASSLGVILLLLDRLLFYRRK